MTDLLDIRIAPKLDRTTHKPVRSQNGSKDKWEYWRVKDYPGYGVHGKDSTNWDDTDWNTAIDIFEDRIYGRFLKIIVQVEKRLFSGFAVMALDCLLCETLQQFYEGVNESEGSTKTFVKFLTSSSFQQHFGTDKNHRTSKAGVFYDQIRCGILHMAEVKKTSLIVFDNTEPLVRWNDDQQTGLVVNRRKFHQQLVEEFDAYLFSLRSKPINLTLLPWDNFKKKMDFIARI